MAIADTPLPYGLRDIKVTGYTDDTGTALEASSVDLPNARTLSFSETEEFTELRGDDRVVTTRGKGAQVEWELESGGLPLEAVVVMFGGTISSSGTTPNEVKTFRKTAVQSRPFFKLEGQAISDSGGDVHVVLYRCRATGNFEGELADGEFWLTSGSGVALPNLVTGDELDVLYDFIQNETAAAIS